MLSFGFGTEAGLDILDVTNELREELSHLLRLGSSLGVRHLFVKDVLEELAVLNGPLQQGLSLL